MATTVPSAQVWLFGPRTDLAVFAGSALLSVLFVALAPLLGAAGGAFPLWAFVVFVVCVDVAHVWSTLWRVYLDGEEVRRRFVLYAGVPLAAYLVGFVAYGVSAGTFWTVFAYAAVVHFVRQQYGWVALYNRRARSGVLDTRLDALAIHAATVGPVLWWHSNLPRPFWWFVPGDFLSLPGWVGTLALGGHAAVMSLWLARQVQRAVRERTFAVGKVCVVIATWVTWYGGIVLAQSDFAFTAMNVLLHGVPYFALLYRYARGRAAEGGYGERAALLRLGVPGFLALLVALAFVEELLWDKLVWHEHPQLFGADVVTLSETLLRFVVPLLALPQATHYLLDAFIWRARLDPALPVRLGWTSQTPMEPAIAEQPGIARVDKPHVSRL